MRPLRYFLAALLIPIATAYAFLGWRGIEWFRAGCHDSDPRVCLVVGGGGWFLALACLAAATWVILRVRDD
jgi:hypothetical protein